MFATTGVPCLLQLWMTQPNFLKHNEMIIVSHLMVYEGSTSAWRAATNYAQDSIVQECGKRAISSQTSETMQHAQNLELTSSQLLRTVVCKINCRL